MSYDKYKSEIIQIFGKETKINLPEDIIIKIISDSGVKVIQNKNLIKCFNEFNQKAQYNIKTFNLNKNYNNKKLISKFMLSRIFKNRQINNISIQYLYYQIYIILILKYAIKENNI